MYLKKITISGFKSFADRLVLNLDKTHLTGVVGPNGSGKSNIIDAVRWVMGEQNAKKLRGEKATDIIFAGSERRKPLSMAEVSLSFDNSENSPFCPVEYRHIEEITVSRRIYADGSREYSMNGKACRFKDITEFFVSSSLGSRSYSMIQQGQVDRILQAKPEEIRQIVEEAAGTLVFKNQEGEAQKKIDSTRTNLSRIEDVLKEVEVQITTLKAQAERSDTWEKLINNLKETEIKLWSQRYHQLIDKEIKFRQKVKKESSQDIKNVADLSRYEAELATIVQELDESDPEIKQLSEDITNIREHLARSDEALKRHVSLVSDSDSQVKELKEELTQETKKVNKKRTSCKDIDIELIKITKNLDNEKKHIEGFDNEVKLLEEQRQVFKNSLENLREDIRNIDRIVDSNKGKIELINKSLQKLYNEKNEKISTLIKTEDEHSQDLILHDGFKLKVASLKKDLDIQVEKKSDFEKKSLEIEKTLDLVFAKTDSIHEQLLSCKAEELSLKELVKNTDSIKDVEESIKDLSKEISFEILSKNIALNKKAKNLSKASLSSFESWVQRIVFKSEDDFEKLAFNLKEKTISVAFQASIPHNEKLLKSLDEWSRSLGGVCALELTEIKNKSKNISKTLGRVYFLNKEIKHSEILPALDLGGTIITPSGLIRESMYDIRFDASNDEGVLSLSQRLSETAKIVKKTEKDLSNKKEEIEKLKKQNEDTKKAIKETDASILEANKILIQEQATLLSFEQRTAQKEELIEKMRLAADESEKSCDKQEQDQEDLKESTSNLQSEHKETTAEIKEIKDSLEEVEAQKEELKDSFQERQLSVATLSEKVSSLEAVKEEVAQQFTESFEKEKELKQKLELLKKSIANAKSNKSSLEKEIRTLVSEREEKELSLGEKQKTTKTTRDHIKELESKIKVCRDLESDLKRVLSENELEIERTKLSCQAVVDQAKEKYDIKLKDHQKPEKFDILYLTKKLGSLKAKSDNFGPVNMIAAKEYQELLKRKDFIIEQKSDILNSIDILEKARLEIEERAKFKFMATYESLNKEFKELFPILFPGGEGSIELTDVERPLQGGVEIMVRLPGKKQQKMNLFSGGEKALTAISLIFALLKSNPTPFCFLDEVDAPLDESNIRKFNKVLQSLSDKFQFIVISHSRRTMEVFDTLYGVTMAEPGVSKLVSIDLTDKALPDHLLKNPKRAHILNKAPDRNQPTAVN